VFCCCGGDFSPGIPPLLIPLATFKRQRSFPLLLLLVIDWRTYHFVAGP